MITEYRYIIFPEGEMQEIDHLLRVGQLVDINGFPLSLPLTTNMIIAYYVVKVRRQEERGILQILHYLELVSAAELEQYLYE